jgi:hypothetical protein
MNDNTTAEPTVRFNEARTAVEMIQITGAGVELRTFAQQVDYAKYMATAGFAVRKELRSNTGACIAIVDMALRWGFAPYQVAKQVYAVNDQMGFESQLIHAVIEKFAPLSRRLRPRYIGEGDSRQCIVEGHIKGELEPLLYESPKIAGLRKNSPLWTIDPDQQLWYYASRAWCRRYCPEIILGLHTPDELRDSHLGFDNAKDVTPHREAEVLAERLSDPSRVVKAEGFHPDAVSRGMGGGGAEAAGAVTIAVDASEVKKVPTLPQDTPKQPDPAPTPPPPKNKGGRPPLTEQQRAERAAAKEAAKRPEMPPIPEQFRRTEPEVIATDIPDYSGVTVEEAAPAPDRGAALVRPLPATVGEYAEHVDRWTKTAKTPQEAEAQWAAEISLRNKCGLVEQERMQIRRWVDDCIKKLRGGK